MGYEATFALMLPAVLLLGWSLHAARRAEPGRPPLVPHGAVQFFLLVLLLMLSAHLLSLATGAIWRGRF